MEVCVCGNELGPARVPIRRSPCRCTQPGPGPGQIPCRDLPSWVSERQHRQRRELGLPVVTPAERAVSARQV